MYPDSWKQAGPSRLAIAVSCWVPRTRMHLDEIGEVAGRLSVPAGAVLRQRPGLLTWQWGTVVAGQVRAADVEATLDSDGHLFVAGFVTLAEPDAGQQTLDLFSNWVNEFYLEILSYWTALHADVLRGVVNIGQASIIGSTARAGIRIVVADPPSLAGSLMSADRVKPVLLAEACRRFIYSTTTRFRAFGAELNRLREDVIHGKVVHAEQMSVLANQRIEDSRTVRTRLEIAVQTIRNRLDNHPETVKYARQELVDLILVAEHMQTVWATQERNFEWVVQHVSLRVGISERGATRTFTAAVFSVAVVALMRDVVDSSLTIGIIQWSQYRAIILVLGCIAVFAASYLLFLAAKRLIR